MYYIAEEDMPLVVAKVKKAIEALAVTGTKRVDIDISLGDQLPALELTGYWVVDIMRIDIKVKK
jgi:hypothetical protein